MWIQTSLGLCTISQDVPLLIQTTVCGPIFLALLETRPWILSCMVERGTSIKAHFRDSFEYFCMRLFSLVNINGEFSSCYRTSSYLNLRLPTSDHLCPILGRALCIQYKLCRLLGKSSFYSFFL